MKRRTIAGIDKKVKGVAAKRRAILDTDKKVKGVAVVGVQFQGDDIFT